jgi:flagellar L-ring protein precursor FlgH
MKITASVLLLMALLPGEGLPQTVTAEQASAPQASTPGAIWSPGARLGDVGRDLRASQVDDILTIQVVENASALAKGSTMTQRASATSASIPALGGITRATGPLANLAGVSGSSQLAGGGSTSRDMVISTVLTARVTGVMPNGVLAVQAIKDVMVNSERQVVTVNGLVRPADIQPDNSVRSDRIGQLEVRVNGKGVVGDAVRRPFFLYRLLMGILPF